MRRTLLAALLAAPLLLAFPSSTPANPPEQCLYGMGCGGFCLNLFGKIHQHGPLYNYGPYYGYPPFEPYGPWNAYLQYNPWYYGDASGSGCCGHGKLGGLLHSHGCGSCGCGWLHAGWLHGGWFHGHGCLSCGHTGLIAGHGGWLKGHTGGLFAGHCKSCGECGHVSHMSLFGHSLKGGGCSSCGSSCKGFAIDTETTDPVTRYAGAGHPTQFAAFYSDLPTLTATAP